MWVSAGVTPGNEKTDVDFNPPPFYFFIHGLDLDWYEKSEETHAPQVDPETVITSVQEASEPFCPRDLVPVVFPGPVSQEGCCQFTCELLKHIMYQRQQLPLPYEQLKHFYRKSPPQVRAGFGRKWVVLRR